MLRRLLIIAVLWTILGAMPRAFAAPLHDALWHTRIQTAKATLPHIALLVHRQRNTAMAAARKPMPVISARSPAGSTFGDGDALLPVIALPTPPFGAVPNSPGIISRHFPHRFSFVAASSSPRDPPFLSAL